MTTERLQEIYIDTNKKQRNAVGTKKRRVRCVLLLGIVLKKVMGELL